MWNNSVAACDEHLPELLRTIIPKDTVRAATVRRVATADPRLFCKTGCEVRAEWYVRVTGAPQ